MSPGLFPRTIPVVLGREEAQQRAQAELAKAKYGGTPEWVSDVGERTLRLLDRLSSLIERLLTLRQGSDGGVNWVFVAVVVLLVAAISLVVWRVGLPRWRRSHRNGSLEMDATTPATDYRQRSSAAAEAGDWTAAVRDRFRAVVRELEVRTILDVRPARTAWEAAYSAARELPECTEPLRTGAAAFNDVVYGDRPADATAYAQMVTLDELVTAAADRIEVGA